MNPAAHSVEGLRPHPRLTNMQTTKILTTSHNSYNSSSRRSVIAGISHHLITFTPKEKLSRLNPTNLKPAIRSTVNTVEDVQFACFHAKTRAQSRISGKMTRHSLAIFVQFCPKARYLLTVSYCFEPFLTKGKRPK